MHTKCEPAAGLDRDQYLDYLTGRRVERPLLVELFGPLVGLEGEWRAQGASDEEIDLSAFGFDFVRREGVQVCTGLLGGESVVLEDGPETTISRDRYGRTMKLCKQSATIPLPLDYPVKDMDSWLRIKPRYEYAPERFVAGWAERARAARAAGKLICLGIPGAFSEPRALMGDENVCMAYYDDPELLHDMIDTFGRTCERILEEVTRAVTIDHLSVHEDMAGRSGPLAGPEQVLEYHTPYYRRCWEIVESRGGTTFGLDSDGDIRPILPQLLQGGVNEIHPAEPAAGMDIVPLRQLYPALMIKGGIDKFALLKGPAAIRRELEYKCQPSMRRGGVVFGLDHRIPNGVTLENYRYYVKTAREILGLDPNPPRGWQRMAF